MKKKRRNTKPRTIESFAMCNFKKGKTFLSLKQDKDITAIATHYKRHVITERFVAIDSYKHQKIVFLTKVTIIN
jgi:hypothetical protein